MHEAMYTKTATSQKGTLQVLDDVDVDVDVDNEIRDITTQWLTEVCTDV